MCSKANRKSQTLSLLVEMAKTLPSVSMPLIRPPKLQDELHMDNTDHNVRKRTFGHVRPATNQIRLRTRSLILIVEWHILDSQGFKFLHADKKDTHAAMQADLSLRWAHMSEGTLSHVVTLMVQIFDHYCEA